MTTIAPTTNTISSSLGRMGLSVQRSVLSCGANHLHIPAPDDQSSLVLAVPISLTDNSGVAHVLEHLLLTGSREGDTDSLFFQTRAASSAVDMNAVTNSRYLAVHFTCTDSQEYATLLETFTTALFKPGWSQGQLKREVATITNEMTGAFSDKHFLWLLRSYQALFVEGSAQFNPGGDPDQIASVDLEKLQAFWRHHFSPAGLIAVSYGRIPKESVRQSLEQSLSRFGIGCCRAPMPSIPTKKARLSNLAGAGAGERAQKLASAILLTPRPSKDLLLDVAFLGSFFARYASRLEELFEDESVGFAIPPGVKEVDGDYVVFVHCHPGCVLEYENLWCEISSRCETVIRSLSPMELGYLVESALNRYYTLGNHKFGTGVAAAFELLDSACRSVIPEVGDSSLGDVETVIEEFSDVSSWVTLFKKSIGANPKQTLVVCDEQMSSISAQFALPEVMDIEECTAQENPDIWMDTKDVALSAALQSSVLDDPSWLIPDICKKELTTIYHFRLPRPWISTAKLTVPLPVELNGSKEWLQPRSLSAILPHLASVFPLNPVAVINAWKVPGCSAYRLYLSLSGFEGVKNVDDVLNSVDALFSQESIEQIVAAGDPQQQIQKISLPPHKIAIYRSASHVTDVAKAKLALAGYEPTDNTVLHDWQLDTKYFTELSKQSKLLFFTSAGDVSERMIGVLEKTFGEEGAPAFIDERDGTTPHDFPDRECISGELNYCARVWTLDDHFGVAGDKDAIPFVFSALVTNLILEPVLRGENHAYAASADIDLEMGVLAMFSYRDPNLAETDTVFNEAFQQILAGNYDATAFEQARRRSLSRLHNKGNYDQRCEQKFDRLAQGFDPDYFIALEQAIGNIAMTEFSNRLSAYFKNSRSSGYALVGNDSGSIA